MITRRSFLSAGLVLAASPAAAAPAGRIRIAQMGTRHSHAAGKMTSVRGLPELYEMAGLSTDEKAEAAAYAGLPRFSEADLLALPGLEAVVVETAMENACRTALAAVRAGKHVHLDKPGSVNHAEFKAMRLEAEQRGLTVQMGYMLRHNPAFAALFEAVKAGWLGEILEIDAMMGKLADRAKRKELGGLPGGGMFELACHVIDAVVTVLGPPGAVRAWSTPSGTDGVKDNQLAVLEYPRATATVRCNHADPFGGPRRRFQVTGTKGSMEIMPLESGRFTARFTEACGPYKKGEQTVQLPVPDDRYRGEFIALADAIRGGKPLPWNAAHDIAVHDTLLRASGAV